MNRRAFARNIVTLSCGLASSSLAPAFARDEPESPLDDRANIIGPRPGFSPQLGTLVSMLTWMRGPVLRSVQDLDISQLDYLHDAKANTIGALLLHLAATERLYQLHTFEGRKWGDWDGQTKKEWLVPMNLGQPARETIKGNNLRFYLDALRKGREKTLKEFGKRDDTWLMQVDSEWPWGPTNNYCKWFHVCEHESHHDGQIDWLKGRLPAAPKSAD
ncbi:MAG: DinB family protein [Chthoniobacterales bacterium]